MITFRKEEYEKIEDGEYIAELSEVKENVTKVPSQYGPSLRFSFKLLEQPYIGRLVSGLTTASWKAGNKLDDWLTALGIDGSTVVGTELPAERVLGAKVRVYIESNPKSGFTNVKIVKPLRATDQNRLAELNAVAAQATPAAAAVAAPVTNAAPAPVAAAPAQVLPQTPAPQVTAAPAATVKTSRTIPF